MCAFLVVGEGVESNSVTLELRAHDGCIHFRVLSRAFGDLRYGTTMLKRREERRLKRTDRTGFGWHFLQLFGN